MSTLHLRRPMPDWRMGRADMAANPTRGPRRWARERQQLNLKHYVVVRGKPVRYFPYGERAAMRGPGRDLGLVEELR